MTPTELLDAAQGEGSMILVLPVVPRGEFVRLLGRSGPYGEIINVRDGQTVARFSKAAVRRFVERRINQECDE